MSTRIKTLTIMRDDGITRPVNATTPGDEPNAHIEPVRMSLAIAIRAARVFMQSFVAFLTVAVAPDVVVPEELTRVMPAELGGAILLAAKMALYPAFASLTQNTLELLVRLDQAFPLLRAGILLPLLWVGSTS